MPAMGVGATPYPIVTGPGKVALPPAADVPSARESKDKEWLKWAERWLVLVQPLLAEAPMCDSLGDEALPSLRQILKGKAAATLRRHVPGWKLWLEFAFGECVHPGDPC